ncbi:MAG: cyclodeaminase/cyclohydrolase family protein [Methanomassiliicoccales archaeon]
MGYADCTIKEFVSRLSSSEPVPGGGSASAIVGALASALIHMDCTLTTGKESYASIKEETAEIMKKSASISRQLLRLADRDARSFRMVMKAIEMPKNTELQKLKRFEKIQEALKEAAIPPLEIMKCCRELEDMARFMAERGNKSSRSDAVVGEILASAALKSAYENLQINLEAIKDEKFVNEMNRRVSEFMRSESQFVR